MKKTAKKSSLLTFLSDYKSSFVVALLQAVLVGNVYLSIANNALLGQPVSISQDIPFEQQAKMHEQLIASLQTRNIIIYICIIVLAYFPCFLIMAWHKKGKSIFACWKEYKEDKQVYKKCEGEV